MNAVPLSSIQMVSIAMRKHIKQGDHCLVPSTLLDLQFNKIERNDSENECVIPN